MPYLKKNTNDRCTCLNCDNPLYGRPDKKFCSEDCKDKYYYQIRKTKHLAKTQVIEWIDFNYQILRGIIATKSKSVNRKEIDALGFRAEYCSYYKITNRHRILRCYDIEYCLTSKKILNIHYVK